MQAERAAIPSLLWLRIGAGVHSLISVLPFTWLFAIYALAFRAQDLIGHWPRPGYDDPKWIGPMDQQYQFLFHLIGDWIVPALFWGSWLWLLLTPLLVPSGYYSRTRRIVLSALFVTGWLSLYFDPGNRFSWWLD